LARNLITDVPGVLVGNAQDARLASGVTVLLFDEPAVASIDVRGGGPGTRETDALDPTALIATCHAICLSGGSAFGLEAASGIAAKLSASGQGFRFTESHPPVPIVPAAILFDLANGGDKSWGDLPPYRELGAAALKSASGDFALGSQGAGTGAMAGQVKGGIGSCSWEVAGLGMVGAIVAANSVGSVLVPGTSIFWAAPFAQPGELGVQAPIPPGIATQDWPIDAKIPLNTTIGAIAIEAEVTRAEAGRIAIMAQDGYARAIRPIHTPFDGDTIFVLSTSRLKLAMDRPAAIARLGAIAADCMTRAVARGVYEATSLGAMKSYREAFRSLA